MINMDNDVVGEHNASFLKYLEFIQDVITRMNRNAFQLKGWCITVVAALSALAVNNGSFLLFFVAAIATIPFGLLDAYYLLMERQFRGLYTDVINGRSDVKIFSMPINRYTRKEAMSDRDRKKYSYSNVVSSSSVIGFYGPICLLCLAGWFVCSNLSKVIRENYRIETPHLRFGLREFSPPSFPEPFDRNVDEHRSCTHRGYEESFKCEYKRK